MKQINALIASSGLSGAGLIFDYLLSRDDFKSPSKDHPDNDQQNEFRFVSDPGGLNSLYNGLYKNFSVNNASYVYREFDKYLSKLKMIKEKLKDSKTSDDEAAQLRLKLQKIPLNALSVRKRNRCALTGRPRGVYRKFTLGRTKLREMAMSGLIPGLTKASW